MEIEEILRDNNSLSLPEQFALAKKHYGLFGEIYLIMFKTDLQIAAQLYEAMNPVAHLGPLDSRKDAKKKVLSALRTIQEIGCIAKRLADEWETLFLRR